MKILKNFKHEIIKVIVFLFIFCTSLVYVLMAQDDYYHSNIKKNFISKDSVNIKTD